MFRIQHVTQAVSQQAECQRREEDADGRKVDPMLDLEIGDRDEARLDRDREEEPEDPEADQTPGGVTGGRATDRPDSRRALHDLNLNS